MTTSTSFAQMTNNQSISLSSALRANTPPTKGQTTSRKFLTLSIFLLLSFFCTTHAWGVDVTYTVSSTSAVTTSGTAPDGSGAGYSSTYGTKCQLTSGNSMTLTLSGYKGCTITGLTLSMRSNTDKGAGNMSMKIGSTTVASISTAKFNTSSWYGSWSTSYVNVTPSVTATTVGNGEEIVITIAATANSLYCQSFTLTYTPAGGGGDSGDTNCLTLSATSNYPFNSTSASNTSVYSTTIDGITFENKGGYKYSSYLSFNKSLSGAYIANTTPFSGNIESIVVDYSSGGSSYFNMYEGSASKPSSTVVSPSKTGTGSVTYTFSGNNPYFKLALKTTGDYCNINSITICYSNTPASSYTITAQSNNTNYGTVSLNETTITASPKTGYRVKSGNAGYTVTSGTAEVTNNGDNTFSVTPSSDCTITINFEAIPQNTVKWSIKGDVTTTTLSDGNTTMPNDPTGDDALCGTKTFVGWSNAEVIDGNKPTILFKKEDGIPNTINLTNGTTFYAVYADTRTTTSITYTWDLLKQSTTPKLAVDDQIVIAAKDYNYALSTTQNTDTRGAVAVTKNSNSITINNNVQIFTIENGNEEGTFALATGNGYLSGTRRKAGRSYYNQLITATSKSANTSWYIGFTEETTPYIYNEVSEKKNGNNYEYPNYYVGFNYNYDWRTGTYHYYFEAVRDASNWYDYNPENISIYRRTKHENTTTVNSGYTTDCGCTPPQTPLNIENSTVVVNETLDLSLITYTGGTGGQIYQYYCSDAEHTTITDGYKFSATVLGDYEITATQATNNGACETTATFTVTVTCAAPSITPTTHRTTINTPVDLKSIITSTSTMPLTFACTDENVYISGTNFTFLAAGDYTITATQAAGGIYCNGSQEITITVTDPCAGKIKPSVNATANETTITVVWDALDDVTTYRVYNNTTGDSDETTDRSYTFSGLNPSTDYSWTVEAVYSDGCTAAASGTTTTSTPVVTYTVNWNVAGSGYNTGTPTTSVNHGEKVSDLPTTPNPAEHSCGDKVFVGWSKSQFVDGTRPADLFTDVEGSPAITAATTFYAVFADCVTGGDTPEDDTQGEWTLVTDVNDLQEGDKIIIACYSKEKAASELTSAILSVDADVTFSNSGNTLTPSASTLIFTLGGSTGAWKLANSSGKFLGATAVKKLAWDGGTTTWSISISDTEATISNTNNSYGRFLYNVSSPRFTTYTSSTSESMLLPQIYKKTGSGSGGGETPEPEEYTVTLSVLGDIEGTPTTTGEYTLPSTVSGTCAGKTFVGWTTTENLSSSTAPTSDYWAKGTPVIISADVTFYAVFAEESNEGNGEEQTITLTADDFGLIGSYQYKEATVNGYTFVVNQGYLSSEGYIQMNSDKGEGQLFNSTAIPNITSVTVNVGKSNKTYSIYNDASDSEYATDGGLKIEYCTATTTLQCEHDYFTIVVGGAVYFSSIVIEYTPGGTTYSNFSTTCDGGGADPDPETTYTVSFNAGTGTCTTQSLTETSEGAGVTLPTATGCGDWAFAGWATASVTETTTAPTLLAANSNYKPTSNTTLYAVYSKEENTQGGGGGGEELSQTLKYDTWSYSGSTTNKTSYRLFHTDSYVESSEFDLSTLSKVVVYGGTYGGNTYNKLTIAGVVGTTTTTWKSVTVSGSSQTGVNTYTDGTTLSGMGRLRVTSNSGTSSSSDVRISKVEIYTTSGGGSTTTYYNSNPDCGGETPEPDPDPEPTGNAYVKVTSSLDDYSGEYLIVYEDGGVAFNGGLETLDATNNTISVTINNNIIEATDATNAAKFTIAKIDGGYSIQSASGKYIGFTKYDNGLTANTSVVYANSISVSDGVASISLTFASGTVALKYNDASGQYRFRYYKSGQKSIALYKLTSTPASAPARKVAMKKTAAKAAKKAGMARPVVKAPAALAAQECTSYENYTTICCANPITDLKFAAGANSITLYWNTAAVSATATLYNDEECTNQVTGATQSGITNGTCAFTGLAKTTTYYAKVTTGDGCTAVLEVSTERPIVSVAEWAATQINIDINTHEPIQVYLENEVTGGSTSGNQADELFFSKYYEATANVKLVAVYNGKAEAIDLTNYTIKYGKTAWASDYITLKDFGATKGQIQPGEEIILYTMNASDTRDVDIMKCVNEAYPEGTWVQVTTTNNTGKGSLSFGGDKTIALFNGGTMIDIIGGGTASKPNNSGANTKPAWGDAKGWTCDEGLSIDDGTMIGISTNRCLLVRNNTVTSGENAVNSNTTNFVTLCTEWKGAHVPDDDIDDGVSESCENFAFVGTFDYSDYYVKYEELASSEELPADGRLEDGTYKITTPDLHDLACTNMRISVKSATDGTTLVTQDYKVPIIVDQDIQTNNQIYFQYTQRTDVNVKPDLGDKNENVLTPDICAECDIVIRDSKTLTHVEDGKGQFRNMMVYPNAKMDNKAAKPFNLNTLQMQGKNDEVSYAIIENDGSTIDVGDMVFVKRIDDKYWYNFSLPYDCKVADIIQQNGQSMGKYWVDWGIKEYDGKARQEGGNSAGAGNVGLYWKKVEETATLKAHQGYIIGLFTTEWTNQMKFVYFTPTNTNPYRESGDDAKNTTIDSWYTTNKATVAARHRGWNFTGSPYISRFGQSTDGEGLNNTSLIMTGHPEPENNNVTEYETYTENVYVTIPSTQGGKYYSHSVASGVELLPFTAYFVQAADVEGSTDTQRTLTYAKGNRALPNAVPARAAATKQRVLVELLVTAPDGQTDNTGVWVDERYTPEYEIATDLGKMYVAGAKPQLYTLAENGEMMAYHALPDASAMNIPLRLYAPKAGDYTLTLNQRVSRLAGAERVELLYNNAVVANMMLQDYTITANRGTVNGYSLSITRRADVSTAIDNITGTAITVIANDGYISVTDIPTDAQVSVYDMLGRLLATQSANGQTVVNIPAVPQGVYNIVVGNNNGHTTIKTVIK